LACFLAVAWCGCGDPEPRSKTADAAVVEDTPGTGAEDITAPPDVDPPDVEPVDTSPVDAGPDDIGPPDVGPEDVGPADVGPEDTGPADVGPPDAGPEDVGPPDAGPTDLGPTDTGPEPDAGPPETGTGGAGGEIGKQNGTCGDRQYIVYVPENAQDPAPVVIGTHGLGGQWTGFYNSSKNVGWLDAADEFGFILMVPAHLNPNRPSFLHLKPNNSLDWPKTNAELKGVLECALEGVGALYNVDTAAIYWMGFSEGGSSSDLAAWSFSPKIAGAAPMGGAVPGKSFPVPSKVPIYTICGVNDGAFSHVQTAHAEWVAAGHPTNKAWVEGAGHSYSQVMAAVSPSQVYQWWANTPKGD